MSSADITSDGRTSFAVDLAGVDGLMGTVSHEEKFDGEGEGCVRLRDSFFLSSRLCEVKHVQCEASKKLSCWIARLVVG